MLFGPPILIQTYSDMYHCLSKLGSTDWEVTPLPCHTLQTRSKIHNNTLESKQEIIRIHLHPASIINNTRPAKCPLNLTQPHEPLCDIPATQTCNCCLLVVDFSTWNHVKYTENSLKLAANSMACRISSTFRLLHRLPTTSVLSHPSRLWGPQPLGKSQLRTYNNLLNLQAYPFSGVRRLC